MQIAPLLFKEFDAQDVPGKAVRKKAFAPSGGKEEEPLPPPPPTFSEEELKNAERDAYQRGFLDGTKEGHAQAQNEQADVDRILIDTLEHFAKAVAPIMADYHMTVHQLRQALPKLSLSIAKKVAGDALSRDAGVVVENAVLQSLEVMVTEPRITIIVHERLANSVEEKVKKLASRLQTASHIHVQPDSNIPLADWRVEWKHGKLERNTEHVWKLVEQAIDDMLATSARETNEQLEKLQTDVTNASEKE